jgi:hypothetical protein
MKLYDTAEAQNDSMGLNTSVRPADVELGADLTSSFLTILPELWFWKNNSWIL